MLYMVYANSRTFHNVSSFVSDTLWILNYGTKRFFILKNVDGRNYTYLLISSECTLYLLSSLYLPGLARGSIVTLFLYLVVGDRKH